MRLYLGPNIRFDSNLTFAISSSYTFFLFFLSLGVNVYLDVALRRALGIDPKKDSFTIKMTGGPDGAL